MSSTRVRFVLSAAVVLAAFLAGYMSNSGRITLSTSISRPVPRTTTIQVPVPVITERVVKETVSPEDLPTVKAILKENERLRVKVTELSITVAEYESRGSGPLETVPVQNHTPSTGTRDVHFKDWRLEFTSTGETASYTLRQRFAILNTVGKDRKGTPTHVVRLYEVGPGDARTPISVTQTTTIAATPNLPAWAITPRITAGVAYINRGSAPPSRQSVSEFVPTGVVALSWLRRQRSGANEDARWSVLSPALTITDTSKSIGVLPFAFNLGSLPKQPFTNLWVSPYIGSSTAKTVDRMGITLTATF